MQSCLKFRHLTGEQAASHAHLSVFIRERASGQNAATTQETAGARDSKTAQVVAMLQRKGGATISESVKTMGCQRHILRGFMACAMKKARVRGRVLLRLLHSKAGVCLHGCETYLDLHGCTAGGKIPQRALSRVHSQGPTSAPTFWRSPLT